MEVRYSYVDPHRVPGLARFNDLETALEAACQHISEGHITPCGFHAVGAIGQNLLEGSSLQELAAAWQGSPDRAGLIARAAAKLERRLYRPPVRTVETFESHQRGPGRPRG